MIVAGEASSDQLAAQLVVALSRELGQRSGFEPRFFGAGGPRMRQAGVELQLDLVQHALIGIPSLRQWQKFSSFRDQLVRLAQERAPDIFIGVDSFAFNGSMGESIRRIASPDDEPFRNWRPRIVQFVSPQVWASRPWRARRLERTHDLLLSILPFEKEWYARRAPKLKVEFVGNPLVDRFSASGVARPAETRPKPPLVLLLPGSRRSELRRHWQTLFGAAKIIADKIPVNLRAVFPNVELLAAFREMFPDMSASTVASLNVELVVGQLPDSLSQASLALASTGTVTLECAWFGVPTVAMYKTNWTTYQLGRRIVTVPYLAMPNLLAGKPIVPEFIQDLATPENIAGEGLSLLQDRGRAEQTRRELLSVAATLGRPGACDRAARHIAELI
jgi:lipid-A-disaccharide synthase